MEHTKKKKKKNSVMTLNVSLMMILCAEDAV